MRKVLIADDEYDLVEVLRMVLQDEGYRVVTAENGQAGATRVIS